MKIAIVGGTTGDESTSVFVNGVLLPALTREENKDYGLDVWEGDYAYIRRIGEPTLRIRTFTDPQEAAAWLAPP